MKKRVLVVLALMLAGVSLHAAITLSLNLNDNYQAKLEVRLLRSNRITCRRIYDSVIAKGGAAPWVKPGQCTQAEACVAAGAVGGASCTPGQANTANARIYSTNQGGRENFAESLLKESLDRDSGIEQQAVGNSDYCDWFCAQSDTVKEAECTKIDSPIPCDPARCLSSGRLCTGPGGILLRP